MTFDETLPFRSPPPTNPIDEWTPPVSSASSLIENVLMDPSTPIIQVLKTPGILLAFREKNPALILRITEDNSIREIIKIFQSTEDKDLQIIIFQLFFSSNSNLLQTFAGNVEYIDLASEIFDNSKKLILINENCDHTSFTENRKDINIEQSHNYCGGHLNDANFSYCDDFPMNIKQTIYNIGITTQIFLKAIKNAPAEVLTVLLKSDNFFKLILENLEIEPIFQMAQQMVQLQPVWFHTYLWGYLVAYINERTKMPEIPKNWNVHIPSISNCFSVKLNSEQRSRVLNLFTRFFQTFMDQASDFNDAVNSLFSFIISTSFDMKERLALFDIGQFLPSNNKLLDIALDIIDERIMNTELTQKALDYLTFYYDGKKIEPIVNFLFRALNPESINHFMRYGPNNFVLQSLINLIDKMMERALYPRFFAKVVQHCISYSWNNNVLNKHILFLSTCLSIGEIVGDMPSWDGWTIFQENVVDQFSRHLNFTKDEKINTKNWDNQLINKLLTHSSVIEMTIEDQRPFYYDLANESDETRSAESGSYAITTSDFSDSDEIELTTQAGYTASQAHIHTNQ
ncbi:hypothetical protein TRFO_05920 [Tritrichomonas foetus]|uniref:Uncharacterized protein n=1 Tax=Tritrichomonas foetus TaxID=1144522 RepID=A0A1J4K1S7_9EUKA|nr:hypothetical protein TRFO_05920 [Tritrichomonas foetus]|eukprot:OHT05343.1 hypothetical protein TRFO_05920 [Tritrichomonas foetus]